MTDTPLSTQLRARLLHLGLALLAVAALASEAPAQYSSARSAFEKVQSNQSKLSVDRERRESLDVAKNLYDACSSLMDTLRDSGRELSEFGNTYGDERGRPRRAAAAVRGQAEVTRSALDAWMRKLQSIGKRTAAGPEPCWQPPRRGARPRCGARGTVVAPQPSPTASAR